MTKKKDTVTIDADAFQALLKAAVANRGSRAAGFPESRERLTVDPEICDPKWKKIDHTCPQCDFTGNVATYFGVRKVRGVQHRQSWCADCRSKTNYHAFPRSNAMESYHTAHGNVHKEIKIKKKQKD